MKRFIAILFFILLPGFLFSQHFRNGIGIRGGFTSGIEYRHFLSGNGSARVLLGQRHRGMQLYIIYEYHQFAPFDFVDEFSLVYGAGIHGGYKRWREDSFSGSVHHMDWKTRYIAGIDGLMGMEYSPKGIPFSCGIEFKPLIDIGGIPTFDPLLWDIGFTLRYLF